MDGIEAANGGLPEDNSVGRDAHDGFSATLWTSCDNCGKMWY